jgi:hypothetical protein
VDNGSILIGIFVAPWGLALLAGALLVLILAVAAANYLLGIAVDAALDRLRACRDKTADSADDPSS